MKPKWYKKISTWLTILVVILVVPLIILFGTIMVKTFLYPDLIPDFMGYKPMIVLSDSMSEIRAGDLAIVKMVDTTTLKTDDIIAFRNSDDTATLHRIVSIVNDEDTLKYVTKGDNNNSIDALKVEEKQIEGIYLYKIDNLGNVLMFLQKPTVLILICTIIIVVGGGLTIMFSRKSDKQ
ncbi:MAG: signal peptidase I [bacterium]|nr:signal peptidase I [bacterium]